MQFVKHGKKQFLHRDGRATSNAGEGTVSLFRALHRAFSLTVPAGGDKALIMAEYLVRENQTSKADGVPPGFMKPFSFWRLLGVLSAAEAAMDKWQTFPTSGTRRATIGRSDCRVATALQRLITWTQLGRQSACTQNQIRLKPASALPSPKMNGKMLSASVSCSSKEMPFLMSRLLQKCCT